MFPWFQIPLSRCISYSSKVLKSHYQVLEVSPKATQAEIKAAYYKLSLIYHPDRNEGDSEKFQAITAAYEVLGNYNSRKIYDRGLSGGIYDGTSEGRGFSSPVDRHRPKAPVPQGRTPVYDFDEWSRLHYGINFARKAAAKQRYHDKTSTNASGKDENVVFSLIAFAFVIGLFLVSIRPSDIDRPSTNEDNNVKK